VRITFSVTSNNRKEKMKKYTIPPNLLLYFILGVPCFFLAEGMMYIFYDHAGKVPPLWAFAVALILSTFLLLFSLAILFFLFAIFYAICCGMIVWIGEKLKPCEKSPNGRHKWEEVEEDRTRRTDWGCIPGTYCAHCGERKKA